MLSWLSTFFFWLILESVKQLYIYTQLKQLLKLNLFFWLKIHNCLIWLYNCDGQSTFYIIFFNTAVMASKLNFKAHFGTHVWSQVTSSTVYLLLWCKKYNLTCFCDLFEIKHTMFRIFNSLIYTFFHAAYFKAFAVVFNITPVSLKIYVLPIFSFFVYRFHRTINCIEKYINTKL